MVDKPQPDNEYEI